MPILPRVGCKLTCSHRYRSCSIRNSRISVKVSLSCAFLRGRKRGAPMETSTSGPWRVFGDASASRASGSALAEFMQMSRITSSQKDDAIVTREDEAYRETETLVPSGLASSSNAVPPAKAGHGGSSWVYVVALCTVSVLICYADRSNISTAIIQMAEEYNWEKDFQGAVGGSFFYGYAATQLLGGQLADLYGAWSFMTFVTPLAAECRQGAAAGVPGATGLGEGVAFPAIHAIISKTVPASRKSTAAAVVTAASYAGTAAAFVLSPFIIAKAGWEWIFYLFGAAALLWLPIWVPGLRWRVGASRLAAGAADEEAPRRADTDGPDMAASEAAAPRRRYGASSGKGSEFVESVKVLLPLLRRREVWAICITQYCQSWAMYGLLFWLPRFFEEGYGVDIQDLGPYTTLPYVVQGVVGAGSGLIADALLVRGWSIKSIRRWLQVAGMLGPATCLLLAVSPVCENSPAGASALITVGQGFSALTLAAISVNQLDIAPRHAGMVFGAGNTAATLAGLLAVPVTGIILQHSNSWSLVFTVMTVHYVIGAGIWYAWVGDKPLPEDAV